MSKKGNESGSMKGWELWELAQACISPRLGRMMVVRTTRAPLAYSCILALFLFSKSAAKSEVTIRGSGFVTSVGLAIELAGGIDLGDPVEVTWTYSPEGIEPYQSLDFRNWFDAEAADSTLVISSPSQRWVLTQGYIQNTNVPAGVSVPSDHFFVTRSFSDPRYDPAIQEIPGGIPGQTFRYNFTLGSFGGNSELLQTSILPVNGDDLVIGAAEIAFVSFELGASAQFNAGYRFESRIDLSTLTIEPGAMPTTNEGRVQLLLRSADGAFPGETLYDVVGAAANPDHDHLANIFEVWCGTDPASADVHLPYSVKQVSISGTLYAALEVSVDAEMDDLLLINGQLTQDLKSYREGIRTVLSDDGTTRVLQFRDPEPLTTARAFARFTAPLASDIP